jgi:putative peptidoglycan lipid II flippase
MTLAQAFYLRRELGGFELGRTLRAVAGMLVAAALLGVVAYYVWELLDDLLGRGLPAQLVSVGTALALGSAVYAAVVLALRIPEAGQIIRLIRGRVRRGAS